MGNLWNLLELILEGYPVSSNLQMYTNTCQIRSYLSIDPSPLIDCQVSRYLTPLGMSRCQGACIPSAELHAGGGR